MSAASLPQDFYVYLHRKATTGDVFYVGKGQDRRALSHRGRNRHWKNIVAKHGLVVEIVADRLREWYAHELECELIALHGRRDLGYGPLVNMEDGGQGASGRMQTAKTRAAIGALKKGKPVSSATREACLIATRGRPLSEAHRNAISESCKLAHSKPEIKNRHRAAMIAVAADAERKEKYRLAMIEVRSRPEVQAKRSASLSAALKGKRPSRATIEAREKPVQCIETKMVFRSVAQAIQWLKDSGRHRAVHTGVSMCCKGSQKTAYGYTWRFAA